MDTIQTLHDEVASFVRVVREGSLAGAARSLHVPKSTVSRRIDRLESALEVNLLHRHGRKIAVTSDGRSFYDRVASSVQTIEVAMHGVQQGMVEPRGHIRITAPNDFGRMVLVRELAAFGKLYPQISLELELTNRYVDIVQEGFDLAVRAGTPAKDKSADDLIARKLTPAVLQLAGVDAFAAQVSCIADLERLPFVLFRSPTKEQRLRLQSDSGRVHQLTVRGQFVVHDYAAMAQLIASGAGIGLIPRIHLEHPIPPSPVRTILPELSLRTGHITLLYPTRQIPRRVSLLIDHLTGVYR